MSLIETSMPDAGESIKYRIGNRNSRNAKIANVSNLVPPMFPSECGEKLDISLRNLVNKDVLSPAVHLPIEILVHS